MWLIAGCDMTNSRYEELNALWVNTTLFLVVDAYAHNDPKQGEKNIERLTRQYAPDTLLGSKAGALFVLQAEEQRCNEILANALKSRAEYKEYMQMLSEKEPDIYDTLHQMDLLGSKLYKML